MILTNLVNLVRKETLTFCVAYSEAGYSDGQNSLRSLVKLVVLVKLVILVNLVKLSKLAILLNATRKVHAKTLFKPHVYRAPW